jgi:long-chain acyl-CoA synthetase
MAAQMLGAVPVPVYADAVAEELSFVLAHAEVRYAAVEDQEQIDKILSVKERLPKLDQMVYDEERGLRDYDHSHLRSIDDVIEDGRKALAGDPTVAAWIDAEIAAGKVPPAPPRAWCSPANARSRRPPIPSPSTS